MEDNNISDGRSGEGSSNNNDDANTSPDHSSTAQEDRHILTSPSDNNINDTTTANNNINIKERIIQTKRRVSYADSVNTDDGTTTARSSTAGSSARRQSSSSVYDLWSKVMRKSDLWESQSLLSESDYGDDDDTTKKIPCNMQCISHNIKSSIEWMGITLKTAVTTPSVLLPCIILFIVLSICGILIVYGFDNAATNSRKQTALAVAEQTDLFFVRVLENAFVPLFTMAQFIKELPEFHKLDELIGDRCDPSVEDCSNFNGAPVDPMRNVTHRDMSKVFTTEQGKALQSKFDSIASGIKTNSGLGKALVNIQLAPKGVVSMIYPMVNCEDFEGGWCMNNTGAWGHDLLNDPNRVGIARATVPAPGVVTAGPLNLIQGGETFIARLAINFPNQGPKPWKHSMVVDDVEYPCWGFVVVLLNWKTLKDDSEIYENFEAEKSQFKLTRTDIKDGKTNVVTIAESAKSYLIEKDNVTLSLDTGDNDWVISVGYDDGFSPNYKKWAYPIVFCAAFAFTILMLLVLVSKKEHERLLGKLLPPHAIRKLRKGRTVVEKYNMVTIFFSDIVGYTSMSAEMSPEEVMQMLNDLYTKFDEVLQKHKIFKVETIGDAYLAVGGCPKKCTGPAAAEKVTLFALDIIELVKNFRVESSGAQVFIRVGLASGPAVAGVAGTNLPKYTLFGDTVNFAARMEQTSKKMKIQISPVTHRMLLDAPNYDFRMTERYDDDGELGVVAKGKGRQYTKWVESAHKLGELTTSTKGLTTESLNGAATAVDNDKFDDNPLDKEDEHV